MEGSGNVGFCTNIYENGLFIYGTHRNTVGMRGITTATAYQYNALITRDTNLSFAGVLLR